MRLKGRLVTHLMTLITWPDDEEEVEARAAAALAIPALRSPAIADAKNALPFWN